MIYLDPRVFTAEDVYALEDKVKADILAGAQVTQFTSEGTTYNGVQSVSTKELLDAIAYYWDEVGDTLITETSPNFLGNTYFNGGFNS